MKSPFKFLDSYTKDDREIFFGREREIEELYHRVFESKIMLVYGVSGTGKSSLINCGLANKFQETDWLPLNIRRGANILDSLAASIKSASITPQTAEIVTPAQFKKSVRSLYLDHYKPVFFIFDQFEELFIFGDKEERKSFVQIIKSLVESDLQCRLIFVMREEYMAGVTEFEKYIPTFFANRVRIEKMAHINAIEAIKGPCKAANIDLEEGFAEALLEKLNPEGEDVELTYLQVFLDRILKLATTNSPFEEPVPQQREGQGGCSFSISLLSRVGNVSDLLGSFLDEQISLLADPQTGVSILKTFVSLKGTRKQLSETDIEGSLGTFGDEIPEDALKEYLRQFINLRILKDKNEAGNYELRHDSLAEKIFGKITMMEKELLEVMNFLEIANQQYEKRGTYLSEEDLKYIQYFENKQMLQRNKKFTGLIELSKKYHTSKKRKRRQILSVLTTIVIIILSSLSIWALHQRSNAIKLRTLALTQKDEAIRSKQEAQTSKEEAERQRTMADSSAKLAIDLKYKADNARQIAENELYKNIKNSLSVSAEKMNVLYLGIYNPLKITVSGIPDDKLRVSIDNGMIKRGQLSDSLSSGETFLAAPKEFKPANITVYGEIKPGMIDSIGTKTFRVKEIPDPYASFAGSTGGNILKETVVKTKKLDVKIDMDFDVQFDITQFRISFEDRGLFYSSDSKNNNITSDQLSLIKRITHNKRLYIENIGAIGLDKKTRGIPPLTFRVFDYQSVIDSKNDIYMHKEALNFFRAVFSNKEDQLMAKQHSLEILNAMQNRKPDDLASELDFYLAMFQNTYYSPIISPQEIELRVHDIQNQIIQSNWQLTDVDTVFLINRSLDFASGASERYYNLGLPDFFIQLTEKLLKLSNINTDQKKAISSICSELGYYLQLDGHGIKSLKPCELALSADSSNQEAVMMLPFSYIFNNRFNDAEKIFLRWKDKPWTVDSRADVFSGAFLYMQSRLEKRGITHPDFEKVKELLKK